MRFEDWPQRLHAAIDAARTRTFDYGDFDCWLFPADCVLAMTGIDYAAELRGYKSKKDAYEIIARYGSMEAMISALVGREPIHPAHAKRGDVMIAEVDLAPGEVGLSGAICDGTKLWTPAIPRGLRSFPISAAKIAWSID